MDTTQALNDAIVAQMAEALIYANRDGIIERWNAAAHAMFGFSAEEALGHNLDLMIPEHLRKAHWRGFDAAMSSGKTRLHGRPTLTRALHLSGQKLYVEMSFSLVLDPSGLAIGSVAVARDVTERVSREKAAASAGASGGHAAAVGSTHVSAVAATAATCPASRSSSSARS